MKQEEGSKCCSKDLSVDQSTEGQIVFYIKQQMQGI